MKLKNAISRFVRDERGLETVEWGILAALIVVGLVATITTLGTQVLNKFTALQGATT
jgi:pilus assembly protein Flp/PilA